MAKIVKSNVPYIANSIPYADIVDRRDPSGRRQLNTGLKVVVSIPPTLRAFKYPNLTFSTAPRSNPYVSEDYRELIMSRQQMYRAALQNSPTQARRDAAITKFSTDYDISEFVTSMSWNSSADNGFVFLDLQLDNTMGFFNYLPVGAKVVVWRRYNLPGRHLLNGGKWYVYMLTYIVEKSRSADGRSQTMSISCQDRASFLKANPQTKKVYKKRTPKQITIDICKKEGIPYKDASLPTSINGQALPAIERFEPADMDLVSYIGEAWKKSWLELDRKNRFPYVIHMRKGYLEVEVIGPPGTSPDTQKELVMFNDTDNIESGDFSESIEDETYTVLKATGSYYTGTTTNKNGKQIKQKKKVSGTFYPKDPLVIQAFGKKVANKNYKKIIFKNKSAFRKRAQADIEKLARPVMKFSFRGKGALDLWPRKYVNVTSRYFGVRGNMPLESVSYEVTGGQINVNLEVIMDQKFYEAGFENITKYNYVPPGRRWY